MDHATEKSIDNLHNAVRRARGCLKEESHRREWPELWSAIDSILCAQFPATYSVGSVAGMKIQVDPTVKPGTFQIRQREIPPHILSRMRLKDVQD